MYIVLVIKGWAYFFIFCIYSFINMLYLFFFLQYLGAFFFYKKIFSCEKYVILLYMVYLIKFIVAVFLAIFLYNLSFFWMLKFFILSAIIFLFTRYIFLKYRNIFKIQIVIFLFVMSVLYILMTAFEPLNITTCTVIFLFLAIFMLGLYLLYLIHKGYNKLDYKLEKFTEKLLLAIFLFFMTFVISVFFKAQYEFTYLNLAFLKVFFTICFMYLILGKNNDLVTVFINSIFTLFIAILLKYCLYLILEQLDLTFSDLLISSVLVEFLSLGNIFFSEGNLVGLGITLNPGPKLPEPWLTDNSGSSPAPPKGSVPYDNPGIMEPPVVVEPPKPGTRLS